jgi:hypothetical protein
MAVTVKPIEPPQEKSWNLRNITGTREFVLNTVQQAAFIPDGFKAALIESIGITTAPILRITASAQIVKLTSGKHRHVMTWDIAEL